MHTRRAGDEDVGRVACAMPRVRVRVVRVSSRGHVAVDNIRHEKKLMSADAVKLSVNNCCKKVKVATDSDSSKMVKVRELF